MCLENGFSICAAIFVSSFSRFRSHCDAFYDKKWSNKSEVDIWIIRASHVCNTCKQPNERAHKSLSTRESNIDSKSLRTDHVFIKRIIAVKIIKATTEKKYSWLHFEKQKKWALAYERMFMNFDICLFTMDLFDWYSEKYTDKCTIKC